MAAELIEDGVDGADINHKLFGIKSLKQMQVEHAGFERMNLHRGGKIAVITFPYDLKKQYGACDEDLETLIDVARCIKGVEVAAVIKQPTEENKFRVSMRSSCDFDVSEICAMYGGGGHVRAAGCTVSADSILSAEMTVVVAVEHKMSEKSETTL
jgi:phosphoesterase RecJ-like protein